MSGFQNTMQSFQAEGTPGDLISNGLFASVQTIPGGLVAGQGGVTVGKFAWIQEDGVTVLNTPFLPGNVSPNQTPSGFVLRNANALIVNYLGESSMVIPEGKEVTLIDAGTVLALVTGTNSFRNDPIYALIADGSATNSNEPALIIGSIGATFTSTESSPSVITVTGVNGYLSEGDSLFGNGFAFGTTLGSQISGTTGSDGDYNISDPSTTNGTACSSLSEVMNVSTAFSEQIKRGDYIGFGGESIGLYIVDQIDGTPFGNGNYRLDSNYKSVIPANSAINIMGAQVTNFKCAGNFTVNKPAEITSFGA